MRKLALAPCADRSEGGKHIMLQRVKFVSQYKPHFLCTVLSLFHVSRYLKLENNSAVLSHRNLGEANKTSDTHSMLLIRLINQENACESNHLQYEITVP